MTLADKTHAMLTASIMSFPNPVDTALREHTRSAPFVESKDVLVILDANCGSTPEKFLADVLSRLEHKGTIKKVHFYPCGGSDEGEVFDFARFSEQLEEHLPRVEYLHWMHMEVKNFRVESTTIKTLHLVDPQIQDEEWELNLPNLVELIMYNHTPPVKNFQRALINCPHIEKYFSHKYWNEQNLPALYLPNCTDFTFRRGDCTSVLKLYLPRVEFLCLDACYELNNVQLLKKGHREHREWNVPLGSEQSSFELSLAIASLSPRAVKALLDTGRVLNPDVFDENSDEDQECGLQ